MNECYGKYFILNGGLKPAAEFVNELVYDGESIYEVLRVINGTPIFFSDHIERLEESVSLQGKVMLADIKTLRNAIINLTGSESIKETNLKIVFNYNGDSSVVLVYFTEPVYPTAEQYSEGVKGILYHAERKNPESKVINHNLRSAIYHRLILEGAYEALLVNDNNLITEGSRSNIFFLKDDTLLTAPQNMILNGITRKYILEICRQIHIKVELKCTNASDFAGYDAIFMTGTSPMVLPFNCINDQLFDVKHPLIERLRRLYMLKAEESIILFNNE